MSQTLSVKTSLFFQVSEECKRLKTDLELHKALLEKTTNERDLFKSRLEKLEKEFKVSEI